MKKTFKVGNKVVFIPARPGEKLDIGVITEITSEKISVQYESGILRIYSGNSLRDLHLS